jgi:Na+/phosphate symporter
MSLKTGIPTAAKISTSNVYSAYFDFIQHSPITNMGAAIIIAEIVISSISTPSCFVYFYEDGILMVDLL